jgi:hypothetical protein
MRNQSPTGGGPREGRGPAAGAWHTSTPFRKIPTKCEKIVTEIIADLQVAAPGRRPIFSRGDFSVGFFLGG